jgi:predicted nucleic acid-binding protein
LIIDASVAFKWIVPEEDTDAAMALLGPGLVAPSLILAEVGNAIGKRVRRGELAWSDTLPSDLERLSSLLDLRDEADFIGRALRIGHELNHAIYDCVYLALAEVTGDVMVTADERFSAKVALHPLGVRVCLLSSLQQSGAGG